MICAGTFKVIQELPFEFGFMPSAMCMQGANLMVGLSHMGENMQLKTQTESGNIICYNYDGAELIRKNQCESFGAVLDLCFDKSKNLIFAGINSKLVCFSNDLERLFETTN